MEQAEMFGSKCLESLMHLLITVLHMHATTAETSYFKDDQRRLRALIYGEMLSLLAFS